MPLIFIKRLHHNALDYFCNDSLKVTKYTVLLCGFSLTLLFAGIFIINPNALEIFNRASYSMILKTLPDNHASGRPVIVDLDEKSLKRYGQSPWPRYKIARLLEKIVDSKPSIITLDIIFSEPDRTSVRRMFKEFKEFHNFDINVDNISDKFLDNDLILAEVLGKGPFVLSHQFLFNKFEKKSENSFANPLKISLLQDLKAGKEIVGIPESFNVLNNLEIFSKKTESSGFCNFSPDNDGILRRLPLLIKYHGDIYPSLALATVLKLQGINNLTLKINKNILQAINFKGTSIPVDPQGNLMIKFHGLRNSYEYISAADILDGIVSSEKLKGRIVFVGTSATALENLQTTPFGPMYPGVEVHATAVDNLLTGDYIYSPEWSKGAILIIILIMGSALSFIIVFERNAFSLISMLTFIIGLWLASQQALWRSGLFLETAFPIVSVMAIYIFLVIIKYILENKRADNALKESENRFRTLFKKAPIPMCHLSLDNRILGVNDSFLAVIGYTTDDISTLFDAVNIAFENTELNDEKISRWITDLKLGIAENRSLRSKEYQVRCKDGILRTMLIDGKSIEDSFIISLFDITKRKQEEIQREKLQAQLLQSQKLEAIGSLAGGIAHDFNNMLSIIIGYTEITICQNEIDSEFRENLDKILDAAQRSADITRQLLGFARKQMIQPVLLNLNKSIENILEMLNRLIGENIDIVWSPCTRLCTILMDPSQIDQILLNLCVNAKDAITDIGRISIKTSIETLEETSNESDTDIKFGDYACLAVSDNGCGIDQETVKHIFEPFFTTKDLGHGTGMGLATVYGIVKQNQGFIRINSEPEEGTTFKILLPLYSDKISIEEEASEDVTQSQGETVLVVEDDLSILQLIKTILEEYGYIVLDTHAPEQGINIAHNYKGDIHLLITDMIMPGMNGRDLADQVIAIRPNIKHLFMSGYANNLSFPNNIEKQNINFIQKPFSKNDMASKIRQVLDQM